MKCCISVFMLLLFISCNTMEDNFAVSINKEDLKLLSDSQDLIYKYKSTGDNALLTDAKKQLLELEGKSNNNKYFNSQVKGVLGEVYILQNRNDKVLPLIGEIEKKNVKEEGLYLLKSLLASDTEDKLEILNTGLEKSVETNKIKLFLADLYFLKGNFKKSIVYYDEVFPDLSESGKEYYKKRRDLAFYFEKNKPAGNLIIDIILKDSLTFNDLAFMILQETVFLDELIKDKSKIDYKDAFDIIKNSNIIDLEKYKDKSGALRKDVAYFLLGIISYIENDKDLLKKYSLDNNTEASDESEEDLSPIEDVKTSDYFYTAVLILVEREIMELPDGENFFPDDDLSGKNYYEILHKLKEYYE